MGVRFDDGKGLISRRNGVGGLDVRGVPRMLPTSYGMGLSRCKGGGATGGRCFTVEDEFLLPIERISRRIGVAEAFIVKI
jgi:hypothetical protein